MIQRLFRRLTLTGAICILGYASAMAVPAKPGMIDYRQADGTTVRVSLHGDEHYHYYMSADGYMLIPDAEGNLCFATSEATPGTVRATAVGKRTAAALSFLAGVDRPQQLRSIERQRKAALSQPKRAVEMITNYPTVGSPKALILLVQFRDVKFRTPEPYESFNSLLNKRGYDHNGATGSAYDYFFDNSSGLFQPDFQVFGPVTLDNNESYYGAAEGQSYDRQAWKMATEGCTKLHEEHPELDFSQFDNDGDGFVDNIFIYYAGYGQNEGADSWTIWPHAANVYTYYGADIEFNGVKLGNYACTNELKGTSGTVMAGIGTFCHEFSHILGLPDLYSTNYSGSFTPGSYELMDIGPYNNDGNTPPYMSVYDRMSLGWIKVRELGAAENVVLNPIESNEGLRISTEKKDEFFLLENRQKSGWDAFIEGHGMLIWHIDYNADAWGSNSVNNDPSHMYVDIIEADGMPTSATRAGDPFPGTNRVTSFTSTSVPAMKTWIGVDPDMPLTEIRETDGVISFKVRGGGDRIDPVEALDASDITATSFKACWTGRPEVPSYEVDVCRGLEIVPFRTLTVRDASQVTVDGLTPSTDYTYTVRAVDGDNRSDDSNVISVRTADPTFDMLTVSLLAPEAVSASGFTANWEPLEGADSYLLSLYTKEIIDPKPHTADFTRTGTSSDIVPEGWSTTSTTTDSRAGYFGESRPSLRLTSATQLQTPVFVDDVNYISFWYRGNNTAEADHLDVEILLGNSWQLLTSVSGIENKQGTTAGFGTGYDVKMPVGVKSVRFRFAASGNGSVCIDDVTVGAGGTYIPEYVGDFNSKDVGNVTSYTFDGLAANTTYYYKVRGLSGSLLSIISGEGAVNTKDSSSLAGIDADSRLVTISASAGRVTIINNDTVPHVASGFTAAGITVFTAEVPAGKRVDIAVPRGFLIVRCGDAAAKTVQ